MKKSFYFTTLYLLSTLRTLCLHSLMLFSFVPNNNSQEVVCRLYHNLNCYPQILAPGIHIRFVEVCLLETVSSCEIRSGTSQCLIHYAFAYQYRQ